MEYFLADYVYKEFVRDWKGFYLDIHTFKSKTKGGGYERKYRKRFGNIFLSKTVTK